jgi:predicted nucleotidyltransferase
VNDKMKAIVSALPTIESLLGEEFGSWLEKATFLPNSPLWLSELESAFAVLTKTCGENSVKPYSERLKSAIEQAVSAKNRNELESLLFEVLCLGKLASVAEDIHLLEPFALKGQPVPKAKARIACRECVIECVPFLGISCDEATESASWETISKRLQEAIGAKELPEKFAAFKWRVNLVFISYLAAQPHVLVPLLYGREYMLPTPPDLSEFVVPLPEELGSDGLFALPDWQLISGVAWVNYQPTPLDNPQTIYWSGFIFPNPKAFRRIPLEVAVKLHEALRLQTFPCDAAERWEMAEWLAFRLVQHLREKWGVQALKFWGSFRDAVFWHRRSDIDIVVGGLDWKQLVDAETEIATLSPFVIPVQLIDQSSLPEPIRESLEEGNVSMRDWQEKIREELEQLRSVVEGKFEEWLRRGDPSQDDLVRVGVGSVLKDFYDGVERIFKHIAAALNEPLPSGKEWHKQLLEKMSQPTENRKPVISQDLKDALDEFLRFRHLFRSIYVVTQLKWEPMAPLVANLPQACKQLREEVESFLSQLGSGL